jgi:cytochrome c556
VSFLNLNAGNKFFSDHRFLINTSLRLRFAVVIIMTILLTSIDLQLQENIMLRIFASMTLSALLISGTALAGSDPIKERQALMEDTGDAAKVIGGMLKEKQPFDAEAAMAALKVWQKTAAEAGELFPEGSETGHDTEAKATIWSDREGFNEKLAIFSTAVDAAIAANPKTLEALGKVAGLAFKGCKGCHEGYRVEKD